MFKVTIKIGQRRSGIFIVYTLNIFHKFSSVFIVEFEQVNASWDNLLYFR